MATMAGYKIPGVSNPKGWRWYKGDLHLHTIYSDGQWDVCELLEVARFWNLDFLAITDHNDVRAYPEALKCGLPNPLVLPGVELGKEGGHAIALNVQERVYYRDQARDWDMKAAADAVHAAKGLFYIAHPYTDEPGCRWEHPLILEECDAFEIWNGEPWVKDGNDLSLETWHNWLNGGRRLPGVAGSDAHCIRHLRPGTAFNHVYAPALSKTALLNSIREGRLFVSSGPWLWIEASPEGVASWVMVGDLLKVTKGVTLRVTWGNAQRGSTLKVRRSGLVLDTRDAFPAGQLLLQDTPIAAGWYTAEIWAADGNLLATTNPIYVVR